MDRRSVGDCLAIACLLLGDHVSTTEEILMRTRISFRPIELAFGSVVACVACLALTPAVSADAVFKIADGLYVWSGPGGTGMANRLSEGTWVGSGWDSFPGVSPPWNPVNPVNTGIAVNTGGWGNSGTGAINPLGAVSIAVPQPAAVQVAVPVVAVGAPVTVHVHVTIAAPPPPPAPMYLSINGEPVLVPASLR
jgi:hypothetical protein